MNEPLNINDPLDTMARDDSARRARLAELNSYAAYGCEQGVTGIVVKENDFGEQRNTCAFRRRAEEEQSVLDRRELAGLKFYEAFTFDEMYEEIEETARALRIPDMVVYGGELSIQVTIDRPADPVYLLNRQYHTGSFIK